MITQIVKNDKYLSATQIKNKLEEDENIVVSKNTVINSLNKNYEFKYPIKKPLLTQKHMKERFEWCKRYTIYR